MNSDEEGRRLRKGGGLLAQLPSRYLDQPLVQRQKDENRITDRLVQGRGNRHARRLMARGERLFRNANKDT